jgi:hypothetical protein
VAITSGSTPDISIPICFANLKASFGSLRRELVGSPTSALGRPICCLIAAFIFYFKEDIEYVYFSVEKVSPRMLGVNIRTSTDLPKENSEPKNMLCEIELSTRTGLGRWSAVCSTFTCRNRKQGWATRSKGH